MAARTQGPSGYLAFCRCSEDGMAQYGFRCIETKLYEFSLRCSRCGHVWPDTCLDRRDSAVSPPRSQYIEYKNRELTRQISCLVGCSHPSALVLIARCVLWLFTRKPVFGYGQIADERLVSENRQMIGPHLDAVEILKIQLEGMQQANRITASTFKS